MEPLVHFALVCGSISGPPLRCYSPGNIDMELMEAARNFLRNGGLLVDAEARTASASSIIRWYELIKTLSFLVKKYPVSRIIDVHALQAHEVRKTAAVIYFVSEENLMFSPFFKGSSNWFCVKTPFPRTQNFHIAPMSKNRHTNVLLSSNVQTKY